MVFMNRARAAHGFIALPAPRPSLASLDAQFLYTKPFLYGRSRARHFICFSPCDLHKCPRQVIVIAGLRDWGTSPNSWNSQGEKVQIQNLRPFYLSPFCHG